MCKCFMHSLRLNINNIVSYPSPRPSPCWWFDICFDYHRWLDNTRNWTNILSSYVCEQRRFRDCIPSKFVFIFLTTSIRGIFMKNMSSVRFQFWVILRHPINGLYGFWWFRWESTHSDDKAVTWRTKHSASVYQQKRRGYRCAFCNVRDR